MKRPSEFSVLSHVQSVNIQGGQDEIAAELISKLSDIAECRELPSTLASQALSAGHFVEESVSFLKLSSERVDNSQKTLPLNESFLKIVIDQPLDKKAFNQLLILVRDPI